MVTLPCLIIKWIIPSPYFPLVLRNTIKHPAETMMDVGDETTIKVHGFTKLGTLGGCGVWAGFV